LLTKETIVIGISQPQSNSVKSSRPIQKEYLWFSPVGKDGKQLLANTIKRLGNRKFDYLICVYDDTKFTEKIFNKCSFFYDKGIIFKFVKKHLTPRVCGRYSFIFFAMDDIDIGKLKPDRLVNIMKINNLDAAAPALSAKSYFTHSLALKKQKCVGRFVDSLELFLTVFNAQKWHRFWNIIESDWNYWGWGYPQLMGALCDYKMGIIDRQTVMHTMPVKRAERPEVGIEKKRLFEKYRNYKKGTWSSTGKLRGTLLDVMLSGIGSEPKKISVIMAVYNGGEYLADAVESILNQTYMDFEFIIVNDGSTDYTREILERYNDKRIKVINCEVNGGVAKARNIGIRHASGQYIAVMDADDISLPERLSKQLPFMERNPDIAVLGTACYVIDQTREIRRTGNVFIKDRRIKIEICRKSENTAVWHPSAIIRKSAFRKIGPSNEKLRDVYDKDLWIRLAAKGYKFANLREPLIKKFEPQFRPNFEEHRKRHNAARDYVYAINARAIKKIQDNINGKRPIRDKVIKAHELILQSLRAGRIKKEPIIIGGCGRSGTTLLRNILSCHPAIFAIPEETGVFCPTAYSQNVDLNAPFRNGLLERKLSEYGISGGSYRYCEKTPRNVLYFGRILSHFENNVKLIHIVRDGRDVVTSRHHLNPSCYWVKPLRWVNDVTAGMQFENRPQVLTVRYEDLIQHYESTLIKICEFVGEKYRKEYFDFSNKIDRRQRFNVHSRSIGKWKKDEHKQIVDELMSLPQAVNLLKRYKYIK